jgi:phosphinothricin acetyltransferase
LEASVKIGGMKIEIMTAGDWDAVAAIYAEGIATGHATFASAPPNGFVEFAEEKLMDCALVARGAVKAHANPLVCAGWAALSRVSDRCVYAGVAEVSVYIAAAARGAGVGNALMRELIARSETAGMWTLQAGIFPENTASRVLHERHGFRFVGRRERVGRMTFGPMAGLWRDTLFFERRSPTVGV